MWTEPWKEIKEVGAEDKLKFTQSLSLTRTLSGLQQLS